jgi:lysophospholipase L1-like esterase
MVDSQNGLKREFTNDGLHPNDEGYQAMAPIAETAVKAAIELR